MFIAVAVILNAVHVVGCGASAVTPTVHRMWKLDNGIIINYDRTYVPHPGDDGLPYYKKILSVTIGDNTKLYEFASSHNGYRNVELRTNQNSTIVWVVDIGGNHGDAKFIGCCIDVAIGEFIDEGGTFPQSVSITGGRLVQSID